jgi:macrolide transport system ATP-binding/permease protein
MADTCIEVRDVTRTYHVGDVDVHALCGVNLRIERGEFIAIMGSSGSGKSTLMAILGCLDRPSTGHYLFEGTDVAGLSEPDLARIRSERIGFVFQSFNLLARTSALENVALPLFYAESAVSQGAQRTERARAALSLLGLGNCEHNTPAQLSGGQQQRVAIARADQLARRVAGRRADRQPRHPHVARDHGNAGAAEPRTRRHHHRRDA